MKRLTPLFVSAVLAGCHSVTPCTTVRDCPNTQRCVNHGCADDSSPGKVGESCASSSNCAAGLSCNTAEVGYPGGYCTADCTSATCATGACTQIGTTALCAAQCVDDSTCRQGYGCCATLNNVCAPLGACTPAACSRPIVASELVDSEPSIPGATVVARGIHKVNDVIDFDVPPNTGSVTIMHQAEIANLTVTVRGQVIDNSAVPLRIQMPDGGIAYDDNAEITGKADGGSDYSGNYSFFGGDTPSTAAFTFPNTSASLAGGVPPGTWHFVVNDYANECLTTAGCTGGSATNTYDVSVVLRPLPGGTNLDVAFYIVADMNTLGGAPFTAANAKTDPSVKQMVRTFTGIMGNAGITVRSVTFFDVSAADRARFGTNISANDTGPCDDLDQMFVLSGAHPGNTVNIFLAQSLRFSSQSGGTIVGIDGTIPGPTTFNGTIHSGAVVSAADLFTASQQNCSVGSANIGGCGPDRVGYIAAHESGHYLGLFHTTEANGSDFDPLADTPKCSCLSCALPSLRGNCADSPGPNAPFVAADQCAQGVAGQPCQGGDNLMFWQLEAGVSQGRITAEQAQVMKLNPALQP